MDCMYTNKFTVSINGNEAFINFSWVVPEYDDNDDVSGTKTIREQGVSMSIDALQNLSTLISNLTNKTTD